MTLGELLHQVSFEEIRPFIPVYYGDENCMALYKIHYDILCHLTPRRGEKGNKIVTISKYIPEEWDVNPPRLDASSLEGDYWEVSLAKELQVEQGVDAPWAEIAACCLWHTSFYGFTQEQVHDTYKSWHNDSEAINKVRQQYTTYLPTRKEMLHIRSFRNAIRREMKMHRHYHPDKEAASMGILSHKRKWRKWKRYEIKSLYDERIGLVSSFIERLTCRGIHTEPVPSIKELSVLFRTNHIRVASYQTYTYDATRRKEYFLELIEKYHAFKPYDLENCIICISSSSAYPLTVSEKELTQIIAKPCKGKTAFFIKTDDSLGEELRIDAAFYEM